MRVLGPVIWVTSKIVNQPYFKVVTVVIGLIAITISILFGIAFPINDWLFLSLFGSCVFMRYVLQMVFSHRNNRRLAQTVREPILELVESDFNQPDRFNRLRRPMDYLRWRQKLFDAGLNIEKGWYDIVQRSFKSTPAVGLFMPIHGLELEEVMDSIESIQWQTYNNIRAIFLMYNDTGNTVLPQLIQQELNALGDDRIHLIVMPSNGKRDAMARGIRQVALDNNIEFFVNVDGDTVLDMDNVANGVRIMQAYPDVAGITSNVKLRNASKNWLTRITAQRYDFANRLERGAQSFFKQVTCMSGPFMMLRRAPLLEILKNPNDWEFQLFFGERVGPGDDRRLTSALIWRGHGVLYVGDIVVWTDCPEEKPKWRSQQLRWARSGYREFVDAVMEGWIWKLKWWSIMDFFYLALFPFFLATVVARILLVAGITAYNSSPAHAAEVLAPYVAIILFVNFARSAYGAYVNRDFSYWRSTFYLWLHVRHLMPIKIHAILTLTNSNWLTRKQDGEAGAA